MGYDVFLLFSLSQSPGLGCERSDNGDNGKIRNNIEDVPVQIWIFVGVAIVLVIYITIRIRMSHYREKK